MHQIERLGQTIRPGEGAVIFPEGTRSRDGVVRTFHSGAVRRILGPQTLPIVAVAVGGAEGIARLQDLTRLRWGHMVRIRTVAVFPPVAGKRALLDQLTHAQEEITSTVEHWKEGDVS
jgi:1-acyl-sn-glycerol-3-phosphate acyltransferase